jgi:hypothetical protein
MALTMLIDIAEAARRCKLTVESLAAWAESGHAPHYFVDGKGPLFSPGEIRCWVSKNLARYCPGKPLPERVAVLRPVTDDLPPPALADLRDLCLLGTGGMVSGVYFLCKGDQVVYVGQSGTVVVRIASHIAERCKDFDHGRVFFLPCPKDQLFAVERRYIELLRPRYNGNAFPRDEPVKPVPLPPGVLMWRR